MSSINYIQLESEKQNLEELRDYRAACELQKRIIFVREEDPKSTAGDVGDAYLRLGRYLRILNETEHAELAFIRSLGLLRIFHGKGHEKVKDAMHQIKELRELRARPKSDKIDRRFAEYKRSNKL
ncbi:MAG: hypothetical protein IAF58_08015 [Leptolyngbya sp.]|nr:hypothetical protein [Candidatus Melainabacteria bacterium]